jgi:hypothetical protein
VESAAERQYLGGWAGRGGVAHVTYGGGGGHLNAGGTAVVTFLLLAKECGVNVPDHMLHSALKHFYRYAGRGNNPYGDNRPENGFVDNGKNGNLAFAMAAAASLTPNGEQSVYAGARDVCAMTGFYTTAFMLHGHTGGGIGEIWRSAAMGLLHDKAPAQYRDFMDNRKWHYDLSRRWDGSFGILGGARYDNISWGAAYALTYTIPRKTLRITGAPKTKFVHEYQLPERPWGTKADDAFASIEAVADAGGNQKDLTKETLATDSAIPFLLRFGSDVSSETLRQYVHHRDHTIRLIAARKVMGVNTSYLGRPSGGDKQRPALALDLMKSKDARVRRAIVEAVGVGLSGEALAEFLKPEVLDLLLGMLQDPEESWWVKDAVLNLLGRAPADVIAPHVDVLLSYLKHEEWWLQNAALTALAPVVVDERCYKKVLPAIGELLRTCQRWNTTAGPMWRIRPKIKEGSPEAQKLAATTFRNAYKLFRGTRMAHGGQDITKTYDAQLEFIATALVEAEGGYDLLYEIAKKRLPNDPLPYDKIFLNADPAKFGPKLRETIKPIIRDQVIPEFAGRNQRTLMGEVDRKKNVVHLKCKIDELTGIYRTLGIHDYDWHDFGPDLRKQEWDYFTFDPAEKQAYDQSPWRYRKVTYPKGMEKWFAVDFAPAQAGWKTGLPPFGQYKGKLQAFEKPCSNPDCNCKTPMKTLWDKEVLLVRTTVKVPPLKPGHLYRIRTGQGQHVGSGSGFSIYINGKLLYEAKTGNGRRVGGKPRGAFITKPFFDEFKNGEVTIAATAFLRYGSRAIVTTPPVPQGIFSIWLQEMKLPPLNDLILKSATVVPMLSSAWQAKQDPDNRELQSEEDLFRYDGKFVPKPEVLGSWTVVDQVESIDQVTPEKKPGRIRPPFTQMTFKDNGRTDKPFWIWSGDVLMDLSRYQALKMTLTGGEYLIIESGGFSTKNPPGWKTPLCVLKRADK